MRRSRVAQWIEKLNADAAEWSEPLAGLLETMAAEDPAGLPGLAAHVFLFAGPSRR